MEDFMENAHAYVCDDRVKNTWRLGPKTEKINGM